MSIRSFINSPFNKSTIIASSTTSPSTIPSSTIASSPVIPAPIIPALELINAKENVDTGFIATMPQTAGGLIEKVNAIYDAAGNPITLVVPAGIYNATIYLPIAPPTANGFIGTIQAVIVNNATNAAILTSNTESFNGGAATDYEVLIFDTEDLITIPTEITVRLEVWYGNSTIEFQVINKPNPFDASLRWNPYIRFKTFNLPLVPAITIPAITIPAINIPAFTIPAIPELP